MCRFICIGFLALCVSFCSADTWTVDLNGGGDFTDIQSAINAANPGDIIQIADGIYTGSGNQNISFLGKAITVKSMNGPDVCIVEGDNSTASFNRGFIFESEETRDSVLEGITISDFWFLTCCGGGAGVYIADGDPTFRNCKITDCRIEIDNCPCIISGGGVFVEQGSPLFENCLIQNNSGAYNGGGIACGSDMYPGSVWVFLINCVIAKNTANNGGGIYQFSVYDATIENCTVVDNYNYGLFIENPPGPFGGPTQIRKSIFWGNTASFGGPPVPAQGNGILGAYVNYVQGDFLATEAPQFVDPANNDYHLQWDSPCIDFCSSDECNPTLPDIDGEPRCMGQYVDAGADEVGPKQADFSRNGRIDLADFEIFSSAWETIPDDAGWYLLCDLVEDDEINLNDLQQLCEDWLWQAEWY